MCIVSIFTQPNGDFVFTQSRDENIYRKTSIGIETREIFGQMVNGPVDLNHGGTWIYTTNRYVVSVLNGAFEDHIQLPPYRLSRGLLILELLKFDNIQEFIEKIELNQIEPFTMIMIDIILDEKFILVWDGSNKFIENKTDSNLIVRSSCVSYERDEMNEHNSEFDNLNFIGPNSVLEVHERLIMPEKEKLPFFQTTSFTQVIVENKKAQISFIPRDVLV